jgi:hypothetical protein
MSVRSVIVLAFALLSTGCSDPGSLCNQSEVLSNLPAGDVETLNRVCGTPRRNVLPAVAEPGNVWPQAPERVPTTLDLQRQMALTDRPVGPSPSAPRHARGYGLCRPISRPPSAVAAGASGAPPGVALGLCYAPVVHGSATNRTGPA